MSGKSTATSSYSQQYKDPRWQKKRLEILDRDNFTCQRCDNKESTLHVHHIFYQKERKVWEYGDRGLITLCEECHERVHDLTESIRQMTVELVNKYRDGSDCDKLFIAQRSMVITCLDKTDNGDYIKRLSDCWKDFQPLASRGAE